MKRRRNSSFTNVDVFVSHAKSKMKVTAKTAQQIKLEQKMATGENKNIWEGGTRTFAIASNKMKSNRELKSKTGSPKDSKGGGGL